MRAIAVIPALAALLAGPDKLPTTLEKRGVVDRPATLALERIERGVVYSVAVAAANPRQLLPDGRLRVVIRQGAQDLVAKTLHPGDADLYTLVRFERSGKAALLLTPDGAGPVKYHATVNRWGAARTLEAEPNNSLDEANPIDLGSTVFGSGDEDDYMAPPGADDWFRFEFREPRPKLVYFTLDLMERDNIPVDVAVFRSEAGKPVAYDVGADPVTPPHEVQALEGNKFTTRVLREPGAYYIRVRARHPFYKLRTAVYDVPPYDDPRQAVQTAVDYIIRAGDSWHANTPRKGGVLDRVASVHQETSLCVACHPTHFSQRAQLYALRNGYAVTGRQQLQFLAERFYNTPRPFYGYEAEGATWTRVISAPANVLGRMAALLEVYEKEVTGEHREKFFRGVREYLKLYYKDREKLPPDESNGNQPLVSAYEVAWYAWQVAPELRARLEPLLVQDRHANLADLCYQTLALHAVDKEKHRGQIRRNAERILSLQRPGGQWAMDFKKDAPEAEFQTGHALWALAVAGYSADHPQIDKGLKYLLGRQLEFGGWFDPLQSYENFRTPFRETQMAVLALAEYFRGPGAGGRGSGGGVLAKLDSIWEMPAAGVMAEVRRAAASNDALVRQQAAECLGRLAHAASIPLLTTLLGDDSKMVQRTAAWALRQIIARRGEGAAELERALASSDDRVRWGAARVFATHFSGLVDRVALEPLARLVNDPLPAIRTQALKGLWQWWYWDARRPSRDRIENTILAAMAEPQHPWVERNLREAVYNLADENVRYLYNNWIPLLANDAIRDRAIQGRLAVEAALAAKFARVLESGPDSQKKMLLAGLSDFHLRRADSYQPRPPTPGPRPPARARIGNDVEPAVFFGPSAERLARALAPLLDSPDIEMRRAAAAASYMIREIRSKPTYGADRRYGWEDVYRLAGRHDEARNRLAVLIANLRSAPDAVLSALARDVYRELSPPVEQAAKPGAPPAAVSTKPAIPEYAEFRVRVQPLLEARGPDGNACVHCHDTHAIFRLERPGPGGSTEEQVRGNYRSALKVIDAAAPENSLLLRKPTSDAATEGVVGAPGLSHGGGVRWPAASPQYETILHWIRRSPSAAPPN